MKMERLFIPLLALWLWLGFPVTGEAWWEKGHQIVSHNAARVIAPEMPGFFQQGGETLVYLSIAADQWKQYGTALRNSESPNHFLDLEKITSDPDNYAMAANRYIAITAYLKQGETVGGVGLLPYQIIEYYQRLTGAFAKYRRDPHDKIAQQEALFYGGVLSHYVGDLFQPLHTTIHFDGRVDDQGEVTSHKGIHALVDGRASNAYLDADASFRFVKAAAPYPSAANAISAALAGSWQHDVIYQWADDGKIEQPDDEIKLFFNQLLGQASQFLTNLWYTAWIESESMTIGF